MNPKTILDSEGRRREDPEGETRESRKSALRLGERAIAQGRLEALPNPAGRRDYLLTFSYPEFTCKCPLTGYPDFATIRLWVLPHTSIVELKSLKLYLNSYRDSYGFHEEVTNRILDDLVDALDPKWARIGSRWNPRGNLAVTVTAEHNADHRPEGLLGSTNAQAGILVAEAQAGGGK